MMTVTAHSKTVTLSDEQISALRTWIEASRHAPGWLDGYGLGQSYIDTRTSRGRGITARKRYVTIDHETARSVPELKGMRWHEVEELIRE